ncbi:hypothetical protein [Halorussus halophilus]|uniref:hypothetical protein n=1 Tax=Halorussus halophilus TaxID=2650975 RepID=UPI001787B75B|nr:hypothetical protein [Halorussus halophilus]
MTSPRSRRSLLRTGSALAVAGFTGCLGQSGADTPGGTTVDTTTDSTTTDEPKTEQRPTDTETTTAGQALSVEGVRVQSSLLYLNTPDSMKVASPDERQFVFADVTPSSSDALPPTVDAFELVVDDVRVDGTQKPGPVSGPRMVHSPNPPYDPDVRETGWIAFEVPNSLDADSVELVYETGGESVSKPLSSDALSKLADAPPEFELVSLDAPESVGAEEVFDVSVTVENVGESDATFRGVLNQTRPTYYPNPMVVPVPAGEQREWSEPCGDHESGDTDQYSFNFLSPLDARELTVEVASETTSSSG